MHRGLDFRVPGISAPRSPNHLGQGVRVEHHSRVVERERWSVRPATADDLERLFELVDAVVGEEKWLGAQPRSIVPTRSISGVLSFTIPTRLDSWWKTTDGSSVRRMPT